MTKNLIVIHCSANEYNKLKNISFEEFLKSTINYWKTSNKWINGGYAVIIWLDGRTAIWKNGMNYEIDHYIHANFDGRTNGAAGYNSRAIHICYAGGLFDGKSEDTRTPEQKMRMKEIINYLKDEYNISEVVGHRDLYQYKNGKFLNKKVAKDCPCFDVAKWLTEYV